MTTVPLSGAISTSNLPYTFNPPMHPSLQHIFPEVGMSAGASIDATLKGIYDELSNTYTGSTNFNALRLGRIVMGKDVMSFAMKQAGTRYGFRFLYNPTQVAGGQSVGTNFIADPTNAVTAVLQEGLENISFQLRLCRVPEVMGKPPLTDYHPTMASKDMQEIKARGTQYDVEFLYRVANGVHNTTVRSGTGDIGILLPNPCELYLGPFRSRGALVSISTTDILYSPDMVPMLTDVSIQFNRFLTIANAEVTRDNTMGAPTSVAIPLVRLTTTKQTASFLDVVKEGLLGGTISKFADWLGIGGGDEQPPPSTVSAAPPSSSSSALTGAQVYDLIRGAGMSNTSDANLMTKIAFYESGWKPKAHNYNLKTGDDSYGLWQINILPGANDIKVLGSRIGKPNLQPNDLFDPKTNAQVAYSMWKSRGNFTAWSTLATAKASKISW